MGLLVPRTPTQYLQTLALGQGAHLAFTKAQNLHLARFYRQVGMAPHQRHYWSMKKVSRTDKLGKVIGTIAMNPMTVPVLAVGGFVAAGYILSESTRKMIVKSSPGTRGTTGGYTNPYASGLGTAV